MTPSAAATISEAFRPAVASTFEAYVEAFGLHDGAALEAFRELVYGEHMLLEYSVKLVAGEVHPARFAIIFDGDMAVRVEAIIQFFHKAISASGGHIDGALMAAILRDLDLNKTDMCACGFDLRRRVEDCRFKFWINILDQPLKVDQLLELHGGPPSVLDFIMAHDLPVGVDLDLRGQTRLKLYPSFSREERMNRAVRRRLEHALSPAATALFDRVERINVSFDPDGARVLHLQLLPPQQPDMLAELGLAGHPMIQRAAVLGLRPHVVSLPESALGRPDAAAINLYFIPQEPC